MGDASPLVAVAYRLEDTFQQVEVNGVPTTLYRVVRFVHDGSGNWVLEGGSTETLVGFNVSLISRDGETVVTNGFEPEEFRIVRVEFEAANGRVTRLASDQDNRSRTNQTRQAQTIRPPALAVDGSTSLAPTTTVPSPWPPLPSPQSDPNPDPDPEPDPNPIPEPDPDPNPDPPPPPPPPPPGSEI